MVRPPPGVCEARISAAVCPDDGRDDGQPETAAALLPAAGRVDPEEAVEQLRQVLVARRPARRR